MNFLTRNDIDSILLKINNIRAYLETQTINNDLEADLALEQIVTLDELEACLSNAEDSGRTKALTTLLAQRWERIRHSAYGYTQRPYDPINRLCLTIANGLEPIPNNKDDIDQLAPEVGPYFLLMPSLKAWKDSSGTNIHNFALHQFVLSDNQDLFIPVENCLNDAAESDTGTLKQMVSDPEGRYSLKLFHLDENAELDDDDIPAHVLGLYLQDDVIHCKAKNKSDFILSEEALVEQFKLQLTEEERAKLTEEEQNEKGQKSYDAIKQTLTPVIKKTLKLFRNAKQEIFCRYYKPGVLVPVTLILNQQLLGDHAKTINDMLDNKAGLQPLLSMIDESIVYTVKTAEGLSQEIKLDDAELGENAPMIQAALQQPMAKKAFNIGEEGAIFNALLNEGYRRENQDFPELTGSEKLRVTNHSTMTREYYKYIVRANQQNGKISFGQALWNLYIALGSGAHRGGAANAQANEGIAAFSDYWNAYSDLDKALLYASYPGLAKIIADLRIDGAVHEKCIGFTGSNIHAFLRRYPSLYQDNATLAQGYRQRLEANIAKKSYPLLDNSPHQPIDFSRCLKQGVTLFKSAYTQQAMRYALEHQQELPNELLSLIPRFTNPEKKTLLKITSEQGDTVLIRATSCQTLNIVHDLIKATPKDRLDARNKRGETALMRTVMNKQTGAAIADLLIKAGAAIHATNKFGQTAITLAVRHNNPAVLNSLIKHSTDPILTRQLALRFAIINNSPILETLLLEASTLSLDDQNRLFEHLLPENRLGSQANTVLMYAAITEHLVLNAVLLPLIEAKKSLTAYFTTSLLDAKNANGDTALILAAQNNRLDEVKKLIRAGANIHLTNDKGESAYSIALKNETINISEQLRLHGAKIHPLKPGTNKSRRLSTKHSQTAINLYNDAMTPLKTRSVDDRKTLIDALRMRSKIDALRMRSKKDNPANYCQEVLRFATAHNPTLLLGLTEIVQIDLLLLFIENLHLIDDQQIKTTLLNAKDPQSDLDTPLIKAVKAGNLRAVQALTQAGADIDAINSAGKTALTIAVQNQNVDIITHLLASGADIRPVKIGFDNAFNIARTSAPTPDNDKLIESLLLKAVMLNLYDQEQLLAQSGHLHILDYVFSQKPLFLPTLLETVNTIDDEACQYAILNARDKHGNTTLHLAIKEALQTGKLENITQLIDAGAHVDVTNVNGDSPLAYAIQYQLNDALLPVVSLLLERRASIIQRDSLGKNALDYALELNTSPKVISALLLNAIHLPPDEQSDLLQDTLHYTCVLVYALDKHPHDYQTVLAEAPEPQKTRVLEGIETLENIDFDYYLTQIKQKKEELSKRWLYPSEKNKTVINAAAKLYDNLQQARITFLQSDEPLNVKKQILKTSCLDAIKQAEPTLKPQRGFKVILDALTNLINLRLIVIERINTGKWRFFESETASTTVIRELKDSLSQDDHENPQKGPPLEQ